MFPLPAFLAPSSVYARLLNSLLRREDWARDRLARYSGKTVRFVVGGVQVGLLIQSDGLVQAANAANVPDVTLTIAASKLPELPAILQARDPALIASLMHIQGDAGLASLVSDLARDLRWDIDHDVARLVGDIPAMRLREAGQFVLAGTQAAAQRLGKNMAEFLSEESGMMATRMAYNAWQSDLHAAQQRLDALDHRFVALKAAPSAISAGRA